MKTRWEKESEREIGMKEVRKERKDWRGKEEVRKQR